MLIVWVLYSFFLLPSYMGIINHFNDPYLKNQYNEVIRFFCSWAHINKCPF